MTQQERQILQWIEQDPMISQEALAEKAGITRSSVAVHISNLMKRATLPARATCSGRDLCCRGGGREYGHWRSVPTPL